MNAYQVGLWGELTRAAEAATESLRGFHRAIEKATMGEGLLTKRQANLREAHMNKHDAISARKMRRWTVASARYKRGGRPLLHKGRKP